MYFHLRAVPPPALRNSAAWMRRLFEDDWDTVRERIGRHREEVLDGTYLDHDLLYAGAPPHHAPGGPRADVVLGGRPLPQPGTGRPPFLLLTAAQAARVATFLRSADFEGLWQLARDALLPAHGGPAAEEELHAVLAVAHRDLTAFYGRTARHGDAVVKCLLL
ncbi:DUF1877 family protein [Streptomyces sp. NPDC020490]|uniref:DUF1877 family protein n=1 Tax=Streptomyces sp. NPDC020490 TaxID=3365078 RepID=UPI00378F3828